MAKLYYEDFDEGRVFVSAPHILTKDEIIDFASEYDPQPFHTDEEAAKSTMAGGLIASGWHLNGVLMRLIVESFLGDTNAQGAPGAEEVRWRKPARPGTQLTAKATVLSRRVMKSRPHLGLVKMRWELIDGAGDQIMWMDGTTIILKRQPQDQ